VVKSSGLALKAVLTECLEGIGKDLCTKVVEELSNGLKYQYHGAWNVVLGVLASLTEKVGGQHPSLLYPVLQQLAQLRASDNLNLSAEVDLVVGKAVTSMGPRRLLEAVPLNITGNETDYEFKTSWLIPVMRDNIKKTELAYFIEFFLPLAAKCLDRSKFCAQNNDLVGTKTYEVLTYQIWSLLPGFCNSPTDLTSSFKNIARILGTQLSSRKEIRLDILTSLRHLISSNSEAGENRDELAKFAKNFLPILFNLYTSKPNGAEEAGQRLAALETIKLYLMISPKDLLMTMFDKAMEKGNDAGVDSFTKDAVQDLLRCLLSYVSKDKIQLLYKNCLQKLSSKDHKEQKKTYKIIEEICKCNTEASKEFMTENLTDLQQILISSLSKTSPSSQAPRLRCLISIISSLKDPSHEFAYSSIPESILCIRAVNKKARESAYVLLICVGEAVLRWAEDNKDEALRDYMNQVMVGLAGTPTLIHCTILGISRIYYQFKDIFPQELIEQVLGNILLLLASPSREVSGAGLSFIKVFITSTPVTVATKFLPNIMKSLVEMPEDCKRHCRQKTKFLLERFCRKFGFDLVASLVPKSDLTTQKRLKNIRKEVARRSRKLSDDGSGADEDDLGIKGRQKTMDELLADSSDEEAEEPEVTATKSKKGKKGTWIQDGEEIVDLLSANAAQKITSTKPSKAKEEDKEKKKTRKDEFKISKDGKIIITDKGDSDDEEEKGNSRMMSDEEDEETFESLVNSKKRKISSEAGSMKSGRSNVSRMTDAKKYKPGGSGIHRKLDTPGSEYRSKKGQGDVKRKGKPDPFAYIPISHKTLNKRKGAKSKGVFANVVKAAKKGANKGSKYKVKEVKKMMDNMKV